MNRSGSKSRIINNRTACGLILACLLAAMMLFTALEAVYAEGEKGRQELEIEVVEEIPAGEIEEQAVPLAGRPAADTAENHRHLLLAAGALVCAAGYFAYFAGREKKLVRLRQLAAEAEAGRGQGAAGSTGRMRENGPADQQRR